MSQNIYVPGSNSEELIDLLVQADYLYTMNEDLPIVKRGEVAIRGTRIVYAGPQKPVGSWRATRTINGEGKAVIPGLINSHCHTASIIFRSQTDDVIVKGADSVGSALYTLAFPMERHISTDEWYDLAKLGCLDMIRSGITTINDMWYAPEGLAEAVNNSGLRATIANKIFDVRLENLQNGDYTRYPKEGEKRLRDGVKFAESLEGIGDGLITARIATHASDTCDSSLHIEARAEADRLGIGMHCHAAQSKAEVSYIRNTHCCGPLVYLRDIGLLRDDVVVAHLTYADNSDLSAVAETGASYAHCPTVYQRRGVYPKLWLIRDQGIRTGFATDWMLNDPFEGMRNAIQATRLSLGNANAMSCKEALWLHTVGAAEALGLEKEIGSLEPNKRADLILIDLEQSHLQPYYGGFSSLVFYVKASDVVTSVVNGCVIMEERQVVTLDTQEIMAVIGKQIPQWIDRLYNLGSRSLAVNDTLHFPL